MASKQSKRVYTSGEVARICGVSSDTVSRWFDLGQIEGYRLGPTGDRRIPYENLRTFMGARGIPLARLQEGDVRVLVVDDDPFYLDTIPAILAKAGDYEIATASTGFDAGALVVEMNPQVVILDIHLSDMDGRMVCQRVKAREETRDSRVMAISGFVDADEERRLADFGFDDYLKKPFTAEALVSAVNRLIELSDAADDHAHERRRRPKATR